MCELFNIVDGKVDQTKRSGIDGQEFRCFRIKYSNAGQISMKSSYVLRSTILILRACSNKQRSLRSSENATMFVNSNHKTLSLSLVVLGALKLVILVPENSLAHFLSMICYTSKERVAKLGFLKLELPKCHRVQKPVD